MANQWFRFYNEVLNDPKIQLLPLASFKVWVNALCVASGANNSNGDIGTINDLSYAFRMSKEDTFSALEILLSNGLIAKNGDGYHIVKWKSRQFKNGSDEDAGEFYIYFAGDTALTKIKIGHSKNPWARLSNLQTGNPTKLKILATIKTTESGDRWLSDHFGSFKINGEWFSPDEKMISLINNLISKTLKTKGHVEKWLADYVVTTQIRLRSEQIRSDQSDFVSNEKKKFVFTPTEDTHRQAISLAIGWDRQALYDKFGDWVRTSAPQMPTDPQKAFLGWLPSFTAKHNRKHLRTFEQAAE